MHQTPRTLTTLVGATLLAACVAHSPRAVDEHDHGAPTPAPTTTTARTTVTTTTMTAVPPNATDAADRLARSPRHGEWAMIRVGANDSVRAWVVYPERSTKAPVVLVVHEIFGLSTWIRAMADQVAADGFIAIAPDLLTGHVDVAAGDTVTQAAATAAIRTLDPGEVQRRLNAVAEYGMSLPAAVRRYGITGFCWGGGTVFAHAAAAPGLGAGVAFYGPVSPQVGAQLVNAKAPVLGLYGGNDERVNATIPAADSAFRVAGVRFEKEVYPGAGHGFVRQHVGPNGPVEANIEATRRAWPRAIGWFRENLEGGR